MLHLTLLNLFVPGEGGHQQRRGRDRRRRRCNSTGIRVIVSMGDPVIVSLLSVGAAVTSKVS
jgi:hypothetical protein